MVQHYLTEQDSRAIQRVMQPGETTSPDRDLAIPSTLPLLGKADADIAALALGTFTLQKLKPDALIDSATKRDAYALSAIKLGELVSLVRYAGEASQGFWAASTISPSESIESCVCLISQIIQDNLTLTDAETASLAAECGMCAPAAPPTVSDCSGTDIRDDFIMSFAGWSDTTYTTTFQTPDDYIVDVKLSQLNSQTLLWDDIQSNSLGCAYRHTSSPFALLGFDAIPQTSAASIALGVNIGETTQFEYFPSQAIVGDRVNGFQGGAGNWLSDIFFNQGTGGRLMDLFNPTGTGVFPTGEIPPDQIGMAFDWSGDPVGSGNVTFA